MDPRLAHIHGRLYLSAPQDNPPERFVQYFKSQECVNHKKSPGSGDVTKDPIPRPQSIDRIIATRNALSQFHLTVFLATELAGSDSALRHGLIERIVNEYMPAMVELEVHPDWISFFYHGRSKQALGTSLSHAMAAWQDKMVAMKPWSDDEKQRVKSTRTAVQHDWEREDDVGKNWRRDSDMDSGYGSMSGVGIRQKETLQVTDEAWRRTRYPPILDRNEWPELG